MVHLKRREFIVGAAGAAVAAPFAARAQQRTTPVIGFLRSTSVADSMPLATAFRQGLKDTGFAEGQNVAIEFRGANNHAGRLPGLAADLIRRPVAAIVGDAVAMVAAKNATTTVPIIFVAAGDPVGDGLVSNLNRPGGNVTGVHFFSGVVGAKRLELLRQVVPQNTTIGMLVMPNTPNTEAERSDVQTAAKTLGQPLIVLDATSDQEIDTAFSNFTRRGVRALFVGSGALFASKREHLVAMAARYALPAIYHLREFVTAGGLMSYGASIADAYRQAGIYAGRILKGEKPGDLPVVRSSKFELVINLKTANALGLKVPPTLLATADEVIE